MKKCGVMAYEERLASSEEGGCGGVERRQYRPTAHHLSPLLHDCGAHTWEGNSVLHSLLAQALLFLTSSLTHFSRGRRHPHSHRTHLHYCTHTTQTTHTWEAAAHTSAHTSSAYLPPWTHLHMPSLYMTHCTWKITLIRASNNLAKKAS